MQFQVPQFIDTEDKIIGPLSIRQFIYVCIAVGFSFVLYYTVKPWLWATLSVPILGLALALAFVKVNGQPFHQTILHAFTFYWKPQTYVWQPDRPNLPKNESTVSEAGDSFSFEKLISGRALKRTWRYVQTGSAAQEESPHERAKPAKEHYQIFRALTGERQVAKRVDYR